MSQDREAKEVEIKPNLVIGREEGGRDYYIKAKDINGNTVKIALDELDMARIDSVLDDLMYFD